MDLFQKLGISCKADNRAWFAEDQPSYVSDSSDPNYGKCLGYTNVPGGVLCAASFPTVRRLCRCDPPSKNDMVFGTGLSAGTITTKEQWVFNHFVAQGDVGVMTHFWITYGTETDNGVIIRYYVDGETTASIQFTPSLANGVGFFDKQAPWGTNWFGKGAEDGGWFNNFRIPFQKSIVVTAQHMYANHGGFYMIVRGAANLPINIGGVAVPPTAKLNLYVIQAMFDPLAWINLVNIPSGKGMHFMHTLSVESGNLNFLEGCYHMYYNGQEFPGTILSTGTEDYFDSAWYFNAGEFHFPVSGYTHYENTNGVVKWSAYRFHEMDPLIFNNGFKLVWRNGDTVDPAGIKCMMEKGGEIVGTPTRGNITSYSWVYTW